MFSVVFNSVFAQEDSTKFVLLEYGGAFESQEYYTSRYEVAQEWNIEFKRVALCMVDKKLEDSVYNFNKVTNERLTLEYGEDWEERFKSEVNTLYAKLVPDKKTEKTYFQNDDTKNGIAIELEEAKILFRGYNNRIIPVVSNNDNSYFLTCENCVIAKDSVGYIVRPGSGKIAQITFNTERNDSISPLKTITYRIINLPDPVLYLGGRESASTTDLYSQTLEVKYNPLAPLESNFRIVNWSINYDGETASGQGTDLSNARGLFNNIPNGEDFTIVVTVECPDGINRRLAGVWTVQNGNR